MGKSHIRIGVGLMDDKTKRLLAFAAIPAVCFIALAFFARFVSGGGSGDLMGEAALCFGGVGALIGFRSGRDSNA